MSAPPIERRLGRRGRRHRPHLQRHLPAAARARHLTLDSGKRRPPVPWRCPSGGVHLPHPLTTVAAAHQVLAGLHIRQRGAIRLVRTPHPSQNDTPDPSAMAHLRSEQRQNDAPLWSQIREWSTANARWAAEANIPTLFSLLLDGVKAKGDYDPHAGGDLRSGLVKA